jgi:hypothetical protein
MLDQNNSGFIGMQPLALDKGQGDKERRKRILFTFKSKDTVIFPLSAGVTSSLITEYMYAIHQDHPQAIGDNAQ